MAKRRRTDNTIAKRRRTGAKEEDTDNTIAKEKKDRQYNGQGQTIQ